MSTARGRYAKPILSAAAAAVLVGALGTSATDLGPWYQELQKPWWQPPDWLFGPAWTLIYSLTAISAALAWTDARVQGARTRIVAAFALNALLNVLWSELFFGLHRPDWALAEVVVLWASVVLLIAIVRPHRLLAAWLLVPYLLWVTFAGLLNLAIVRLNAPF